jgi:recombination protein RecT
MAQANQVAKKETPNPIAELRVALDRMDDQFKAALPAHIPLERFKRVLMTAVQGNLKLLRCTRQSLFNACVRAAQDGLLPDGREGAIVSYETEGEQIAQWLPMVAGIRKKVRNSGQLSDWNVQCVQEGDQFEYELGDNPFIRHKPAPTGGRARKVLFAYSIATYPDGTKSREVMNADQIEDVRKKSRAKKGPWHDPIFYPEMARKTVAKLHAKQLPMSTDLDTLLRRDDELYDFKGERERTEVTQQHRRLESTTAMLDHFAAGDDTPTADQTETEESTADSASEGQAGAAQETASAAPDTKAAKATKEKEPPKEPKNFEEYIEVVKAKCAATTIADADRLTAWFVSDQQRTLRNRANMVAAETAMARKLIDDRLKELGAASGQPQT